MRISDWSSDVCSSDLTITDRDTTDHHGHDYFVGTMLCASTTSISWRCSSSAGPRSPARAGDGSEPVFDLEDRKSVGWGKCVSVRVDSGGSRIFKKKKRSSTYHGLTTTNDIKMM